MMVLSVMLVVWGLTEIKLMLGLFGVSFWCVKNY